MHGHEYGGKDINSVNVGNIGLVPIAKLEHVKHSFSVDP